MSWEGERGLEKSRKRLNTPWSPFSVAIIALLLSPGGAVLTILNLHRLGQFDRRQARILTITILLVFSIGVAILVGLSGEADAKHSSSSSLILSLGVATASYVVQATPYRSWRQAHLRERTSSWLTALRVAVVFLGIWIIAMLPIYAIVAAILRLAGAGDSA